MSPFPVDPDARKRLQNAQRAETDALRTVENALRARDKARERLDEREADLRSSQRELIAVSGLDRAATLLGMPVGVLRREAARVGRTANRASTTPDRGSDG
jgi:hypothetical protein